MIRAASEDEVGGTLAVCRGEETRQGSCVVGILYVVRSLAGERGARPSSPALGDLPAGIRWHDRAPVLRSRAPHANQGRGEIGAIVLAVGLPLPQAGSGEHHELAVTSR